MSRSPSRAVDKRVGDPIVAPPRRGVMQSNPPATAPSSRAELPSGHPPKRRHVGVLLINLGSPSGTDYWSVRRYLKQFLSDPRVIEIWRPLWWLILNLVVLSTRPQRSGHAYAQIWDKERNESPLVVTTRAQAEKLAPRLAGDDVVVEWAMRYGEPAIGKKLAALRDAGCERILFAPLYPQYSATTTATANDAAFAELKRMRWQPAVRTLPAYHDDPAYIAALATSLWAALTALAVSAGGGARFVSRAAARICRQGRSVLRSMSGDDRSAARSVSVGREKSFASSSSHASVRPSGCSPTPNPRSPSSPGAA